MNPFEVLKQKQLNLDKRKLISFINPFSYLFFRKNLELFSNFDLLLLDGIGLVFLMRIMGVKCKRQSFDMSSLAPEVFNNAIHENHSVYIIGSDAVSIKAFVEKLKLSFEGLNIIGFRMVYFKDDLERKQIIEKINLLNPDVLIVGMGTPKQECFLVETQEKGWSGIGYSCGGFIHQTAKAINYYPYFFNKYNLRWLYRIYDEPKLFKRYFLLYPKSIALFIFDVLKSKL